MGTGLGGLAVVLVVGWLVAHVRRRLDDPPTEMAVSLLTAYAAYIPAEELGVSGVIAAVTSGSFSGGVLRASSPLRRRASSSSRYGRCCSSC